MGQLAQRKSFAAVNRSSSPRAEVSFLFFAFAIIFMDIVGVVRFYFLKTFYDYFISLSQLLVPLLTIFASYFVFIFVSSGART